MRPGPALENLVAAVDEACHVGLEAADLRSAVLPRLHREAGSRFSAQEARVIRRLAPSIAEGMRLGLLVQSASAGDLADAPGLVLLAGDGTLMSTNPAADRWLDELRGPADTDLPIEIRA